jgi:hypothetical protein
MVGKRVEDLIQPLPSYSVAIAANGCAQNALGQGKWAGEIETVL